MAAEKATAARTGGHFTLAADTVVAVGSRILPKAADPTQVRTCLTLLSGRRHHVITAITLIDPAGHVSERVVDTAVIVARLSYDQLNAYTACDEGIGKAGGYAIQGRAAAFIRQIGGSYSAVVGLPLFETAQLLRGRGYPVP
jgi:septum formation protein